MITWNKEKDKWLSEKRRISFMDIVEIIEQGKYLDIL